jgi:hypothetical protein
MASTYVDRTGGNLPNRYFIPQIYSTKMLKKFYAESVANAICNVDYQQEILGKGNTVHIRLRPDVAVTPSVENEKISWQDVNDAEVVLYINYAYDAAVKIGNIAMHQMDINLQSELIDEIANRLRIVIDTTVLGSAYSSAGTTKTTGAVAAWNTNDNCIVALAESQAVLSALDSNGEPTPTTDRWIVIHPAMKTYLLKQTALYALNAGTPKGALQMGYVGNLAGFDIYESPLVPGAGTAGSPYQVMAGHKSAITLATQFTQFETDVPLQDYYGKGIRAQNCFGFKVVKPGKLVNLSVAL